MLPKTFGSEINAFLYNSLLVDCGAGPEEEGEILLPYQLREEFFNTVEAVLITHGHFDHWGLLDSKPRGIPVYSTKPTAQFMEFHAHYELEFHKVLQNLKVFKPGWTRLIGKMRVETFPVIHSTPQAAAFYFQVEGQQILHLGEFKFCGSEPQEGLWLKRTLREIGRRGIDLLVFDAQNVETPGWTVSEREVLESLSQLMDQIPGRIIFTGFGSNLQRIRDLVKIARALGRPTQFVGSGMKKAATALRLPWRKKNPSLIFISGCQGEEESALWSAAKGEELELKPDDAIIFSSRAIPGKEENVKAMVKGLLPQVWKVVLNRGEKVRLGLEDAPVLEWLTHSSGHASYEDVKLALELTRPKQIFVRPNEPGVLAKIRELCNEMGFELLEEKPLEAKMVSLKEGLQKLIEERRK